MRRLLLVLAVGLLAGAWSQAAPRIEADPTKDYVIVPEAGPWVICAAYFTGPEGPDLARQLVYQIRSQYNLPAYTFNHTDEERRRQQAEMDAERERLLQKYPQAQLKKRSIRIEEQVAVLIGGYPDDFKAREALKAIKKLPPPNLKLSSGKSALDTFLVGSPDNQPVREIKQAQVNPFMTAFPARNPSISQQVQVKKVDPLLNTLNENEDYSLLRSSKPWTLVVKEYAGTMTLMSSQVNNTSGSFFEKLFGTNKQTEALNAAALQAHELARVLRQLNFEAYVLHMRNSSVVAIGSFDSGNDPQMQRVGQQLASLRERMVGSAPNHADPFQLFPSPVPYQVPRP
jgi:hypothetical protein